MSEDLSFYPHSCCLAKSQPPPLPRVRLTLEMSSFNKKSLLCLVHKNIPVRREAIHKRYATQKTKIIAFGYSQNCFGSGSGSGFLLDSDSIRLVKPDPYSESRMTYKVEKIEKFHVLKCWMFSSEG